MNIDKLGPYRIGCKLGKGGMGSVYEAVHEQTGQRVAVKALSPQLATSEGFRERFEAEIESLKKLRHEGIVRLYGWGEDEGVLFYSMELVEGRSLEEEISSGRRFDWRETSQIAVQICRALKHAHDHGVVHRDIKPANVLINDEGKVKLADFGIARLFGSTQLTTAGGVLGTADYMSPEQADGLAVTEKCDQYSLGCVMFALLAGRPPFRAQTMPEMLQLQRYADPEPVRRYAPETPRELENLIAQLLSKEPAKRFPNVMVLARHMIAMEKALSRSAQQPPDADRDGASVLPERVDATSASDAAATRELSGALASPTDTSDSDVHDAPTLADPGESLPSGSSVPLPAEPEDAAPPRPSRFTSVDDDSGRHPTRRPADKWAFAMQLLGLAAALVGLVYIGWRLTQPASAEDLLATIDSAIDADDIAGLGGVEAQLDEFLERFPDHPRAPQLMAYRDELELWRLEKQLRLKSRGADDEGLNAVAQIYAAAIAVADANPGLASRKLENLLTLYEVSYDVDGGVTDVAATVGDEERTWLTRAALQLQKQRAAAQRQAQALLPEIQRRIEAARQLESSTPERAVKLYHAIVELYAEYPWAASAVDCARSRRAALSSKE